MNGSRFFSLAMIFIGCCILINAAPYQELEPRKGYVPVYIRHGDQPLSEVHPDLVEAFHENSDYPFSSANLIAEKTVMSEATETPVKSTTAAPTTESDIASFEAIKAMDEQ